MGSDAVPHAVKTAEDTYHVELVGDNLGMLIGRRGDTLEMKLPADARFYDFCGNERPEGKVILGAVQEMEPTGLAVIVR